MQPTLVFLPGESQGQRRLVGCRLWGLTESDTTEQLSLSLLPASWEACMQVKKQQLELNMEQQTGSKLGKEYIKAIYCHPAYWTYM